MIRNGMRIRCPSSVALLLIVAGLFAGCQTIEPRFDPNNPPTLPTGLSITQDGLREVVISWDQPVVNGKYEILRKSLKDEAFVPIGECYAFDCKYVDKGSHAGALRDSSTYYYSMRIPAIDLQTQMMVGKTAPPPEPARFLMADAHRSRAVKLSWRSTPTKGDMTYKIERALAEDAGNFILVAEKCDGLEFVDGGTPASTLLDSSEYIYRVFAVNAVGAMSEPVLSEEVKTMPPPKQVVNVKGVSDEVRCIPLSWDPSPEPDIARYDVYRSRQPDSGFEKINSVLGRENTSYLDDGRINEQRAANNPGSLEDLTMYYYRIHAVNTVTAESPDSESGSARTRAVPPEVKGVKAVSDMPRKVLLTWEASLDEKVFGYYVWREDLDSPKAILYGRESTHIIDRGNTDDASGLAKLKDDNDYAYSLEAFSLGCSNVHIRSASQSKNVTAHTKKRPRMPADLKATTHLPHSINITWRPNPETDIVEYRVKTQDYTIFLPADQDAVMMSTRQSGLDNNQQRTYQIKAIDVDRLESDWAVIKGQTKPLPSKPTKLRSKVVGKEVRLLWNPPPQPDVVEYAIWQNIKHTFKKNEIKLIGTTTNLEFSLSMIQLDKPIEVMVTAIDKDNLESLTDGNDLITVP